MDRELHNEQLPSVEQSVIVEWKSLAISHHQKPFMPSEIEPLDCCSRSVGGLLDYESGFGISSRNRRLPVVPGSATTGFMLLVSKTLTKIKWSM
jgi:hypothetical protein